MRLLKFSIALCCVVAFSSCDPCVWGDDFPGKAQLCAGGGGGGGRHKGGHVSSGGQVSTGGSPGTGGSPSCEDIPQYCTAEARVCYLPPNSNCSYVYDPCDPCGCGKLDCE